MVDLIEHNLARCIQCKKLIALDPNRKMCKICFTELHPNVRYETTPVAPEEDASEVFPNLDALTTTQMVRTNILPSENILPVVSSRPVPDATVTPLRSAENTCKRCGEPKVQSSGRFCLACQAAIDRFHLPVASPTEPITQTDKNADLVEKFGSRAVMDAYHEKRERAPSSRINMIGGQPLKWWKS